MSLHFLITGGPLWAAPIHDKDFVQNIIDRAEREEERFGTSKRVVGMMSLVREELQDVPLYYLPDRLSAVIHSTAPGFLPLRSGVALGSNKANTYIVRG